MQNVKTRLRHLYIAPQESGNCVETWPLPESAHASTIIDRDRIIIMEGRQSTRDASPAKENAGLTKFSIKAFFAKVVYKCNFVSASCSVEQPMPVTTKCIVSLPEGLQTIHYQLQRFFLSNCKKKSCFKASMMRSATDAMARCLNDEENHAACEQHLKYVTD